MKKRVLSMLLAFILCFSTLPMTAIAQEADAVTEQEADSAEEQEEAEAAAAPEAETSSDKSTTVETPGTEDSTAGEAPDKSVSDSDAGTQDTGADDEKKAAVQKVQALIDALPETVTVENAESVSAQLEAIDEAMAELTEEQREELDMTRLHAISEVLNTPMTVPMTVAEGQHVDHPICGATCTDENNHSIVTEWQPIGSETELKAATEGYYYLTQDIVTTGTWEPNNNVVLCLNGHSIAANGDFGVIEIKGANRQFTLCDCNSSASTHYFIKSVENNLTRWVPCEENTENRISVTGGVITHSVRTSDLGVKVDKNATFTMYGGTICGNKLQGSYNGAGVYVHDSTFNMYGGAIRGNAASWGGGVAALGSTFNMYGGVISDNMVSASAGGVLLSDKSVMNMSGNAQISNNIAPTKWTTSGGGVYIFASTDGEVSNCLYMSDNAKISGNTATSGGAVYVRKNGQVTMSGNAQISNNTATENGGGVYVENSTFKIAGGAPRVCDNLCQDVQNNVYLATGNAIRISKLSTFTGKIGVSTQDTPTGSNLVTVAAAAVESGAVGSLTEEYVDHISSDKENLYPVLVNGEVKLSATVPHRHPVCGETCGDSGKHSNQTWIGVSRLSDIKSSGNYYLTDNVTLDETWNCNISVNLCLNGKTITGAAGEETIRVAKGTTLTITDCQNEVGKITHAQDNIGRGIMSLGTLILYNGEITKNQIAKLNFEKPAVTTSYGTNPANNELTNKGDGAVNYQSSDNSVVTVNEKGEVTVVGVGETTITATAAETTNYKVGTASYKLTVNKARVHIVQATVANKDYDGNVNADVTGVVFANEADVRIDGRVAGTDYTVTGAFQSENAGKQDAEVTVKLLGEFASHYELTGGIYKTRATITAKPISIAIALTQDRSYERNNTSVTILEVTFKDSTNTLVATLTSSDYTATGKMVNANVGTDKKVTVTVTLQGKAADNYKLVSNMTTAKVAITQAKGGVLQEENLKQKFSDRKQKTFTPDYTGLPAGETWTYSISEAQTSGSAKVEPAMINTAGKITYRLTAGAENDTICWTVTISNPNYEKFTKDLVLTLTAKEPQETLRITGDNTVAYGQKLLLSTVGGSGTGEITYRVDAGSTGNATINQNGVLTPVKVGSVVITATKAGDIDYSEITSAPFVIMITRAATSGEPKYNKITTGGMTLADAGLTLAGSTIHPADGTLEWIDDAGVLPNDTAVEMNKTYKWRFIPADTNYEILTGEIELYHVDAPAVTAQPKSVSVTVGDTATFEVTATGTDVTYQWQIDRNDGNGFVNITGATGATYTIGVTDRDCNGFKYRCVLSNAAGSVTTDTVVLTVQYQIIEGANGSWNQNTDGRSLKIRGNGEYSKFQNVKVDGNIIDSKNYTVSEGSTIIELHADYLKTLSEGSHTFEIVWTDGAAGTSFTVARNTSGSNNTGSNNTGNNDNNDSTDNSAAAAPTAAATAQELDKVPATGDPLGIWLMLFAISLTGLAGMLARRKKN